MALDPNLPEHLTVGTMCHCDDPDECDDHWQLWISAEFGSDGEHVRRGRKLEDEMQMRAVASLVNAAHSGRGES